ncbi:MAG TPA: hypothetical protein VGI75_05550 [Pirellulales bacterium]
MSHGNSFREGLWCDLIPGGKNLSLAYLPGNNDAISLVVGESNFWLAVVFLKDRKVPDKDGSRSAGLIRANEVTRQIQENRLDAYQ